MTEREHRLVEELAELGKIYADSSLAYDEIHARGWRAGDALTTDALNYTRHFARDKMIQLVRNYAMEADKNGG